MDKKEKALRQAIWDSFEGCTCKTVRKGKAVPAEDRCEVKVMRCHGRIASWRKRMEKAGLHLASPAPTAER